MFGTYEAAWKVFDRDNDGGLDKEEYVMMYKNLPDMISFIVADLNKDGFFEVEEAIAFWNQTGVTGII